MLVLLYTYQMWLKVRVNEDVTTQYLVTGVVRIDLDRILGKIVQKPQA